MTDINLNNDDEVNSLLRKYLLLANRSEVEAEDDSYSFAYSKQYKRWEGKLLARPYSFAKKRSYSAIRRVLNTAAIILLTIAVVFGAIMAGFPDARAAVLRWFREQFSTHDAYRFNEDNSSHDLEKWRPTYLPEGYAEIEEIDLVNYIIVNFNNESGTSITLTYTFTSEGAGMHVNNEDNELTETIIGNNTAFIYRALVETKRNIIVWIDDDAEMIFSLTSFLPCEELINIAASVSLCE